MIRFKFFLSFFLLLFCELGLSAKANQKKFNTYPFKSAGMQLKAERILSGQGIIWGMDFISKTQLLFTERGGKLKLFDMKTGSVKVVHTFSSVAVVGQGGLLDIKVHPQFNKKPQIYFTYSVSKEQAYATQLVRAEFYQNKLHNFQVLFTSDALSSRNIHFGSRIAFDNQGYIYISIGDRGQRKQAQNLNSHNGTVIRLKEDGSVPSDNPFAKNKKAKKEIWSYGHRNPQGLVFDKKRSLLWEAEHGPRGGDEINILQRGGNYGWPRASYGQEYMFPKRVGKEQVKNTLQPIKYYTPSIAPSGMELYTGSKLIHWKNNIFMGALKLTHLNRTVFNSKNRFVREERLLENLRERIRVVKEGPDEWLYFGTDLGRIFKISTL